MGYYYNETLCHSSTYCTGKGDCKRKMEAFTYLHFVNSYVNLVTEPKVKEMMGNNTGSHATLYLQHDIKIYQRRPCRLCTVLD